MLVAVASPFHGYPGCDNTEHNKKKAQELKNFYEFMDQDAVILVLVSEYFKSPHSTNDNKMAIRICKAIIGDKETGEKGVDQVHFWYPEEYGLSPGMKGEEKLAKELGIPCHRIPCRSW